MMNGREITGSNNALARRYGLSRYYKVLGTDGKSPHRMWQWSLPAKGVPGKWESVEGRLVMCGNGIHACRLGDVGHWMFKKNVRLYEIELAEDGMLHSTNKVASRAGRILQRVEYDRNWSHNAEYAYWDVIDRRVPRSENACPEHRYVKTAAVALQLLIGRRTRNVNDMIEQLVAEQQLAA